MLVVEDEYLISGMIVEILAQAGYAIVGPETELAAAIKTARPGRIDGALLDINLGGELVYPLAEHLDRIVVPYLFVSGYGSGTIPQRFRQRPFVRKPFTPPVLLQALEKAIGGAH